MDSLNQHVLAHRGLWGIKDRQNSKAALTSALQRSFGIETDLRDHAGKVYLSHDPISDAADILDLNWLSDEVNSRTLLPMLALNVKADGLAPSLAENWKYAGDRSFFFDMSWPQVISFVQHQLPVALRASEWEPLNLATFRRLGIPVRIWLDSFEHDWWLGTMDEDRIPTLGTVAVVSPEIHGRDPYPTWEWFARHVNLGANMYLCTDRPEEFLEAMS